MKNVMMFLFLVTGLVVCLEYPCDLMDSMHSAGVVFEGDDPPPSPLPPDEC